MLLPRICLHHKILDFNCPQFNWELWAWESFCLWRNGPWQPAAGILASVLMLQWTGWPVVLVMLRVQVVAVAAIGGCSPGCTRDPLAPTRTDGARLHWRIDIALALAQLPTSRSCHGTNEMSTKCERTHICIQSPFEISGKTMGDVGNVSKVETQESWLQR